jgi:hypothetical protein
MPAARTESFQNRICRIIRRILVPTDGRTDGQIGSCPAGAYSGECIESLFMRTLRDARDHIRERKGIQRERESTKLDVQPFFRYTFILLSSLLYTSILLVSTLMLFYEEWPLDIHTQNPQLMLVWPLSARSLCPRPRTTTLQAVTEAHHMTSQSSPTRVEVETEKFNINI